MVTKKALNMWQNKLSESILTVAGGLRFGLSLNPNSQIYQDAYDKAIMFAEQLPDSEQEPYLSIALSGKKQSEWRKGNAWDTVRNRVKVCEKTLQTTEAEVEAAKARVGEARATLARAEIFLRLSER